jgi:hypothetical protein
MRKKSVLNVLMLILSLAGGVVAYIFGEALLAYVSYMPYFAQCGVYLLFVMLVCCVVMLVSETIHSGNYILKRKKEFVQTCLKASGLLVVAAFALGAVTQLLYGMFGLGAGYKPNFQGTMIICDISGSMQENDPDMEAVEGMLEYIDEVPLGEYLGVIVYSSETVTLREYSLLETEEDRDELKLFIEERVSYDGGTGTYTALLDGIRQMRRIPDEDWPGLIILLSDGLSGDGFLSGEFVQASAGDYDNPKNMIPVNTIYYAPSSFGGYEMKNIARDTGGNYFYLNDENGDVTMRDVFSHSRRNFTVEQPHLLHAYAGAARQSVVRIILQALFLGLWGTLTAAAVSIFLNNNRLIKSFVIPRAVISFVCAAVFAVVLAGPGILGGMPARALLIVSMCIMFLPTFSWE